ncbi:MAG: sigma-54-dependent Fis family transcriptional regulator [Candidatus Riflebacteria bacterium]|nr:sigma-54-dependent Fis family transcriptional regulator [Candidatus Riflebacteria bacterium]
MTETPGRTRVLIVDDSRDTLEMLQRNLAREGFQVFAATNVPDAISLLEGQPVDLVITDLKMPKISGLDLVRHVRDNFRLTEIVMITGYPSVEGAVQAVRTGAEDYLAKPFTTEELLATVKGALAKLQRRRDAAGTESPPVHFPGLCGESPAMLRVYESLARAAKTAATILITGESGTGKELVARAIHYSGARAAAPFVPVNCGSIPEELLESELFGFIKGAFTGAVESRAGFFQTADGGTIFLDEIGEMTLSMQVKLLRVLQDKEIFMVGCRKPRQVDVRILAATNKDLGSLIRKGTFRDDLYYRLNVLNIHLPPLRERLSDIPLLARHFLARHSRELGRQPPRLSDRTIEILGRYEWPGNVRELENLIQRLLVMTDGQVIDAPDLPSFMRTLVQHQKDLHRTLAQVEQEHILAVLDSVGGNKTHAAKILGIDRKTLREKLDRSGGRSGPEEPDT